MLQNSENKNIENQDVLGDGKLSEGEKNIINKIDEYFKKNKSINQNVDLATIFDDKEPGKEIMKLKNIIDQYLGDLANTYFSTGDKNILNSIGKLLNIAYNANIEPGKYRAIEQKLLDNSNKINQNINDFNKKSIITRFGVGENEKIQLEKEGWEVVKIEENGDKNPDKTIIETKILDLGQNFLFMHNTNKINELNKEKIDYLNTEIQKLKENPNIDPSSIKIYVEGSASTIPTRPVGRNQRLAKNRAEKIKNDIIKQDSNLENYIETDWKIQGPEYSFHDYQKNPESYTKFQYSKIGIKYDEKINHIQPGEKRYTMQRKKEVISDTEKQKLFSHEIIRKNEDNTYSILQISSNNPNIVRRNITPIEYQDKIKYTPLNKNKLSETESRNMVGQPQVFEFDAKSFKDVNNILDDMIKNRNTYTDWEIKNQILPSLGKKIYGENYENTPIEKN